MVASVSTQVGETVAASFAAPTLVTIIDLARLEVWAYVDETDIGRVEVAQQATFTVDTYPSTDFSGVVTAIRPAAEIQNNTPARIYHGLAWSRATAFNALVRNRRKRSAVRTTVSTTQASTVRRATRGSRMA